MADTITLTQHQIATALVQHWGRLGRIPREGETDTTFAVGAAGVTATIVIKEPGDES